MVRAYVCKKACKARTNGWICGAEWTNDDANGFSFPEYQLVTQQILGICVGQCWPVSDYGTTTTKSPLSALLHRQHYVPAPSSANLASLSLSPQRPRGSVTPDHPHGSIWPSTRQIPPIHSARGLPSPPHLTDCVIAPMHPSNSRWFAPINEHAH